MGKRRITASGLLRLISDLGDELWHDTKAEAYRKAYGPKKVFSLDDYFPSVVEKVTGSLMRKGYVEKVEAPEGIVIKLTDKGRQKLLFFNLGEIQSKESVKWDGKWRMVFFDVAETDRDKRDSLRGYLKKLGLKQMQESVWISPYDIGNEVRYLRELLEIPHSVKLGVLDEIENAEVLRKWFKLD